MYCLILPEFIVFVLFFGIGFAKIITSGLHYFGCAILFIKCWFVMKDIQFAQQAYEQFLASFNSLILGSCSALGEAEASYAPFIRHRGAFTFMLVNWLCIPIISYLRARLPYCLLSPKNRRNRSLQESVLVFKFTPAKFHVKRLSGRKLCLCSPISLAVWPT